jgi:hypothetical protein
MMSAVRYGGESQWFVYRRADGGVLVGDWARRVSYSRNMWWIGARTCQTTRTRERRRPSERQSRLSSSISSSTFFRPESAPSALPSMLFTKKLNKVHADWSVIGKACSAEVFRLYAVHHWQATHTQVRMFESANENTCSPSK